MTRAFCLGNHPVACIGCRPTFRSLHCTVPVRPEPLLPAAEG